eukprot:scaffold214004_cov18-Tisochrysis_lutea.AAC.1
MKSPAGSRNIVVRAQAQQGKTEAGLAAGRRSVLALGAGGLLATGYASMICTQIHPSSPDACKQYLTEPLYE